MRDLPHHLSNAINHLQPSYLNPTFKQLLFFQKSNSILFLIDGTVLAIDWKISITFHLPFLDQTTQHENAISVIHLHHLPKIVKRIREWSLGHYSPLALDENIIGVDVMLHVIFLGLWT